MRSSYRAVVVVCWSLVFSACGHSCSCESSQAATGDVTALGTSETGTTAGSAALGVLPPTAAASVETRAPIDTSSAQTVFPDLPSASDRERLAGLATRLRNAPALDKNVPVIARERLLPVLPQRIAGFGARGTVVDGPVSAGTEPIRVLSRTYTSANRELYVKVTDTLRAAPLRAAALAQLGEVGNTASGYVHGRLLAGYPAAVQYYPQAKNAQVVLLLGNRYLIEVRLVPAESAEEALILAQRLPLSGLAGPEPASDALRVGTARATASGK